jgi:hypothetical protein
MRGDAGDRRTARLVRAPGHGPGATDAKRQMGRPRLGKKRATHLTWEGSHMRGQGQRRLAAVGQMLRPGAPIPRVRIVTRATAGGGEGEGKTREPARALAPSNKPG